MQALEEEWAKREEARASALASARARVAALEAKLRRGLADVTARGRQLKEGEDSAKREVEQVRSYPFLLCLVTNML